MCYSGLSRDQSWPPTGATTLFTDTQLDIDRRAVRRTMRATGAIERPTAVQALLFSRAEKPVLPMMCGSGRDREGRRSSSLRAPILNDQPNQLHPTSRSELAPNVLTHPGPPLTWIPGRTHSLRSGPDTTNRSQPLRARQLDARPCAAPQLGHKFVGRFRRLTVINRQKGHDGPPTSSHREVQQMSSRLKFTLPDDANTRLIEIAAERGEP